MRRQQKGERRTLETVGLRGGGSGTVRGTRSRRAWAGGELDLGLVEFEVPVRLQHGDALGAVGSMALELKGSSLQGKRFGVIGIETDKSVGMGEGPGECVA